VLKQKELKDSYIDGAPRADYEKGKKEGKNQEASLNIRRKKS